jgi:hypothetical protein
MYNGVYFVCWMLLSTEQTNPMDVLSVIWRWEMLSIFNRVETWRERHVAGVCWFLLRACKTRVSIESEKGRYAEREREIDKEGHMAESDWLLRFLSNYYFKFNYFIANYFLFFYQNSWFFFSTNRDLINLIWAQKKKKSKFCTLLILLLSLC